MGKLIIVLLSFWSTMAMADGFECLTFEGDLQIDVYNHVNPEEGTRTPAVMIVSDPMVSEGYRLIARFTADDHTLTSAYDEYGMYSVIGWVEEHSGNGGEYISGTRLAYVDSIDLIVDFRYGDNYQHGESLDATLRLFLRGGEILDRAVTCTRYLKEM